MLRENFRKYLTIERQYSSHTINAYFNDLSQLGEFLSSYREISLFEADGAASVTHHMLRNWMADLLREGNSHRTVGRKISSAKTYFSFLQKSDLIHANPAARVKVPKFEKKLPAFLKESETENLFGLVEYPATFEGTRDKAILEILYGCGLRRAELIGLNIGNVDLYQRTLKVLGKGGRERVIPFGSNVEKALKEYLHAAEEAGLTVNDTLFMRKNGHNLYPKLVYRLVKKYLGQISSLSKKSPHILRHTFATHLLDKGADLNAIKELLGHSSLASTQVYTHNSISKLQAVHNQAHPRAIQHKKDPL